MKFEINSSNINFYGRDFIPFFESIKALAQGFREFTTNPSIS